MNKELENRTDHELLMELIEDKRRQEKLRYIKWAVAAVIIIAVVVLLVRVVPPVVETYKEINTVVEALGDIDLEDTLQSVNGIRDEFYAAMDKVGEMEESFEKLQEFGEKLESIDFDGLSEVINGFSNLVNKFPFLFK